MFLFSYKNLDMGLTMSHEIYMETGQENILMIPLQIIVILSRRVKRACKINTISMHLVMVKSSVWQLLLPVLIYLLVFMFLSPNLISNCNFILNSHQVFCFRVVSIYGTTRNYNYCISTPILNGSVHIRNAHKQRFHNIIR